MKKWIAIILVLFLSFTIIGCKDRNEKVEVKDITINGAKATIEIDEELQLTAKVLPDDAEQGVNWSSKEPSIITIDETGKAVGISAGKTTITATSKANPKVSKSVTITVNPAKVEVIDVIIEGIKTEIEVDEEVQLTAKVSPQNAEQGVTWSSKNPDVISVDATGKIVGVAPGTTTITATSKENNRVSKSVNIKVLEPAEDLVELVIEGAKTEIEVDEELQLTAKILPLDHDQDVTWSSEDPTIIAIDETGKIVGIAEGTTTITAVSNTNNEILKTVTIKVNAAIQYDDPTGLNLDATSLEVKLNQNISIKATVTPETALQKVIFSSSNEAIATVDENGKVTGVALGEVTITVKVAANEAIVATCAVRVIELTPPIDEDKDPEKITIMGENSVNEGRTITLIASVEPSGVSQNVIWESANPAFATVSDKGVVTGLKSGKALIIVYSEKNPNIYEFYEITILPKIVVVDYPDMGGNTIVIMAAAQALNEHDPNHKDYNSADKAAKKSAWEEVQDKFNVVLSVEPYPDDAPWGPARVNWMIKNAGLNTAEADIYVSTTEWLKELVDGNAVLDTTEFYKNHGQNSLDASMKAASTYKGLYAVPTALTGAIHVDQGLFYNYKLIQELGLDSPAKLFNEDKWHYGEFVAYVKQAHTQLGEDQTVLSGHPALYYMGMVNAAGIKLVDTITKKVNFSHNTAQLAAYHLNDLYSSVGWGTIAWDQNVTSFNSGKSIFSSGEFWFVDYPDRWPSTLWDEGGNSLYGYVPYPYPDNKTNKETNTLGAGGACYMMASGREYPAGVTAENIYQAFVTMMLWTERNMKADPEYDELLLMRNQAARKLDDPYSITAITSFTRDKVIFDPAKAILPIHGTGNIGPALVKVVQGDDYAQTMAPIIDKYFLELQTLYG